jgi:hypothetical protein
MASQPALPGADEEAQASAEVIRPATPDEPPMLPVLGQDIPEQVPQEPISADAISSAIDSARKILQDIVFGPDGRFRRVVRLNRHERRTLRHFEPGLDTNDLESAKELIRYHLHHDHVSMVNVGFTLMEIRDRCLFTQDGFLDFATWLKIEAKEVGISVPYAYRLLNIADALDRYLILTFMGQWRMSIEDVLKRMKKLSYFMTGIYRHLLLKELKAPFLASGGPEPFIALVMGKPIPTKEEIEAAKARRHQSKNRRSPVIASSDLERAIVEAIQLHQDVYIIGLKDPADAKYIEMAVLANRRKEADDTFALRTPAFIKEDETPPSFLQLRTLEDAKAMILYHQAEGIPHRLVCAAICARLEDDPELIRQWKDRGYSTFHEFLITELGVTFDTYRYASIGRNYLNHETKILQHFAIDTEVSFSKLFLLNKAIENHGDVPHLIWLYFGPGPTFTDWNYFAEHKDFQSHFSESKMSEAQLKKARTLLFEFKEAQAASGLDDTQRGPLAGLTPHVFSIVAPHEKHLIDVFIANPQYLNKFVQLYFDYKNRGLL